jgi:Undecaprenyl-phosphate galactose phosphotransferase WbaP
MPGIERARLVELLDGPLSCYRTVMIIPDLFEVPSLWVRPRDLNGILGLEITSNLASPMAQFVKRAVDIVMVLLFIAFWVPICLVVGLLIKLQDGGHPIFKQERVGRDGRVFHAWKFRTMVPNAELVLEEHMAADPALREEWETTYKLKVDPRVTRLGQFLRRFSIDELPQLVNVLRGEMALVGPRPLPRYHHEELNLRVRELRERIRPGITGLWQVSGRSDTGTEGIERWDAYYVRNWSLWFDAIVLIRTARTVIGGTGAY